MSSLVDPADKRMYITNNIICYTISIKIATNIEPTGIDQLFVKEKKSRG